MLARLQALRRHFAACLPKTSGKLLRLGTEKRRCVEVALPADAFEMNYVFTDGEGATNNNQGKNYMTPVQGSMTSELWEEKAVERLVIKDLTCISQMCFMTCTPCLCTLHPALQTCKYRSQVW